MRADSTYHLLVRQLLARSVPISPKLSLLSVFPVINVSCCGGLYRYIYIYDDDNIKVTLIIALYISTPKNYCSNNYSY